MILVAGVAAADTIRYGDGTRVSPTVDAVIRTTPHVVLNAVPGFGVGSYLQRDVRSGVILTVADIVAWGLIIPSSLVLNDESLSEDEGGIAVLGLVAGYGIYAASRVGGVFYPIRHVVRNGVDRHSVVAPIFYNTLPGFGLGSFAQGDPRGGALIAAFDVAAYVALGVLSAAALGMEEGLARAAGITLVAAYGTARAIGIARPFVFRARQQAAAATPE
ncbi:MAG: hypothetical protein EA382_04265 [Spirochaetaceae bacterium]|nr:MAG: hypothetical protein EA382_04265 [Spirochaetaceae bacterium]